MIAKGNILYSRDTKGKVRVWWMEQEGNKYRTCSGLQDGEIVTTDWTVAKGKNTGKVNETTDIQQAAREVDNKYKKQRKTGYFDNITDIDTSSKIDCLLAKKYSDYQDDIDFTKEEWFLQYKYNGCLRADTLVDLADGTQVPIKKIVDDNQPILVKTYNTNTGLIEIKPTRGVMLAKAENDKSPFQWYNLEFENGQSLTITSNHRIWVENLKCWRRVEDLDGTEDVLPLNLH